MTKNLVTTLGLTQLAQTWSQRLGQAEHDALVVVQGPAALVGSRFALAREAGRIEIARGEVDVRGDLGRSAPARGGPSTLPSPRRESSASLRLPSPYVSEPHAALETTESGWRIVDLESNNHTYVGTVKVVAPQQLVYGDEVRLGDVVLIYVTAERSALPAHAVDQASGLLATQVMIAEATRLLSEGERPSLLLLRLEGLRERLASSRPSDAMALVRAAGQRLLQLWSDEVLLGRLEADLFAAAWGSRPDDFKRPGQQALEALSALLSPHGIKVRGAVLAPNPQSTDRFPRLLACATAALRHAEGIVEARPEVGELLADGALLTALAAHQKLPLLVLALEDEDRLRHHLGHDRLAAWRWHLRRLISHGAPNAPVAGVLEDRLFVVALDDSSTANALTADLEHKLRDELDRPHGLRTAVVGPDRPAKPSELQRVLLRALDHTDEPGPRESVETLPTPVAAPYSLIWVVASHTARVKTVLDCADVVVRFLTCAAIATLAAGGDQTCKAPLQKRRRRRLPLGEWIGLLRTLAPALPATALREALGVDGRGVRLAYLLEREILPRRNRFVHGELAPRESQSANLASQLLAELNAVVRTLTPLAELQLISVLESSPRRSGGARATVRIHTGPRENFEIRQIDVRHPEPLYVGSSYLTTLDYRELVELSPLVRLQPCPRCDREELFVADSLPTTAGEPMDLSAVSTGHRLRWTPTVDDLPQGLVDLLGE